MTIQPTLERSAPTGTGTQRLYRFDNGYGASVVRFTILPGLGSHGADRGLWELAVLRFTGDGIETFELTYDTGITDDVMGYLSEDEVQETLAKIRDLPAQSTVPASGEESAR